MLTALQEKQIEKIAERAVIKFLKNLLADPDRGLEITPGFEKKLKKSIASRKAGKLESLEKIICLPLMNDGMAGKIH